MKQDFCELSQWDEVCSFVFCFLPQDDDDEDDSDILSDWNLSELFGICIMVCYVFIDHRLGMKLTTYM